MKYTLYILFFVFSVNLGFAQQKRTELQTKSSLAIKYYNARDYEKAMPLLEEVYKLSRNSTYFRYYVNCMVELKRYESAEALIQQEIKKQKIPRPEYYVHWGRVLQVQGKTAEADQKYQQALDKIQPNKGSYLITANAFLGWGNYEYSKRTYIQGRELLEGEQFNYELARANLYLRNYDEMMEEYLNLLRESEKHLSRVQSSLSSAMRLDIDNGLRDQFRGQVLKRIQSEPEIIGYNRLLIWFFIQEKKFSSALRQSIALDKRTGGEAPQISELGRMALGNKDYVHAKKAFRYIMDHGEDGMYYKQAYILNIRTSYLEFISVSPGDKEKGAALSNSFVTALDYLGYGQATLRLIQDYAHLLAFYLNDAEKALAVLDEGLRIPKLIPIQVGQIKTEKADIYVYADDPWEAMLIYSQVIEANKKNQLGDDAKLKKAKLGYYMGNFSWAKAQLDVLKASTSKLTANDAMALSMLIGNNLNLDTTAVPLTMFSKADLLFFQNKPDEAMVILDGLMETYPYHTLVDDILFRKAKVEVEKQNFEAATEYLQSIVNDFSYDLLGDDALFMLAEIYHYNLDRKEEAKDMYKQMLTMHPGSVFIEESRGRYRELREIYPDKKTKEELFMEGKKDLFQRAIESTEF